MRAFVVGLMLLLAGCLAPAAVDDRATGEASHILPWQLTECRYLVGWSDADPAVIQANLPDGFIVQAGTPLGLPLPEQASRAIIGTEAFECASGSGLDGPVEPMTYASIWIPVAPPAELADPDASAIYYKIHVLVPDAPRRDAMAALGLSVGSGEVAWMRPATPGSVGADLTIEGAGDFRLELLAPRQGATGEGDPFMEITPAGEDGANGFAIWRADYEWTGDTLQRGDGFITWPAGHWVTDAIGMERAPARFHAGVWSFNGTVTLPIV